MSERETYEFHLVQDGMVAAAVSAGDRATAWDQIWHYALIYGQDGPVEIHEGPPADEAAGHSEGGA